VVAIGGNSPTPASAATGGAGIYAKGGLGGYGTNCSDAGYFDGSISVMNRLNVWGDVLVRNTSSNDVMRVDIASNRVYFASLQASNLFSADNSLGISTNLPLYTVVSNNVAVTNSITIKNGLITATNISSTASLLATNQIQAGTNIVITYSNNLPVINSTASGTGGGTVTSITVTSSTFTVTGSPITTSGVITIEPGSAIALTNNLYSLTASSPVVLTTNGANIVISAPAVVAANNGVATNLTTYATVTNTGGVIFTPFTISGVTDGSQSNIVVNMNYAEQILFMTNTLCFPYITNGVAGSGCSLTVRNFSGSNQPITWPTNWINLNTLPTTLVSNHTMRVAWVALEPTTTMNSQTNVMVGVATQP
jgi:hypothetical protein